MNKRRPERRITIVGALEDSSVSLGRRRTCNEVGEARHGGGRCLLLLCCVVWMNWKFHEVMQGSKLCALAVLSCEYVLGTRNVVRWFVTR